MIKNRPKKTKKLKYGKRSERHFLHYVRGKCKKHNITLKLKPVEYVKIDGIRCSGYFDDHSKQIVVAMNSPLALEILVHEVCHLTQFVDNCKPWKNLGDSINIFTKWLSGSEVENINKHINAIVEMELDNEKRSVKMINKFGLDIDVKSYIKKANSYLYFYSWIKRTRKWSSPKNAPYKNKNIVAAMPSTFQKTYKVIPKKIELLYEKEKI